MTVGVEIVTGILGSIIYDGLKRPYKGLVDAVARRKNINRALGTQPDLISKSNANPAIQDIIKVIGNDNGLYDTNVATFLEEVERSAIPDALKQFALCGHDSSAVFPAFDLIYKSYDLLPFSSKALFEALFVAISTRLEQAVEEKVLFEAFKAHSGDLASRIDALSACLRNAGSLYPLPASQFADLRIKIAKGVENGNRQINVETTQGTRKVNILKLVIPARLNAVGSKADIPSPHRDYPYSKQQSTGYVPFRRAFNRAVILGDPGGGKSTLTQLLCYDLASQIGLESTTPRHPLFDSRDLCLPLKVVLRTLEKRQQQNPSYSIFDYFIDEIKVYCDNNEDIASQFLKQLFTLGEGILLFDGLDEILDIGSRRAMAGLIEQFTHAYASCPSLVTSRIVGYRDAPLSEEFQAFTLSRFNTDEVRKFSELLIRAVAGVTLAEAKKKAVEFLRQTEAAAGDLRENPLLLGLMVYIFNARGEVPSNRPEIYKECSLLMFEKWDQRRGIIFQFPADFDLLDLFGYLAAEIFGNAETEDGVSESWLSDRLRSFFNMWYEDRARSVAAAKVLVEFITGRAWVMCEIGPGVFKFTHRTFLEYFFARRLEEEAGGVAPLIQSRLISKVVDAQWDVVSHLAVQIATFRSGPKSVQALDALLKYGLDARNEPKQELNFLTFVARALEYLTVPESTLREAVDFIFSRVVHLGSVFNLEAIEVIHDVLNSCSRRHGYVGTRLVQLAKPILHGTSSPARSFTLYMIGARNSGYRSQRSGFYAPSALVWETFERSRIETKKDQWERAKIDAVEARSYIYVYNDNIVELYERFKLPLVFMFSSSLVPFTIGALPYFIVAAAVSALQKRSDRNYSEFSFNREQASAILSMLSEDLLRIWQEDRLGEVITDSQIWRAHGLIDEMMGLFHLKDASGKKIRHDDEAMAKAFFIYIILFWSELRMEKLVERNRVNIGSDRAASHLLSILVDYSALLDKNEMGKATRELLDAISASLTDKNRKKRTLPKAGA